MLISLAVSTLGDKTNSWRNGDMVRDAFAGPNWKQTMKMKYIK